MPPPLTSPTPPNHRQSVVSASTSPGASSDETRLSSTCPLNVSTSPYWQHFPTPNSCNHGNPRFIPTSAVLSSVLTCNGRHPETCLPCLHRLTLARNFPELSRLGQCNYLDDIGFVCDISIVPQYVLTGCCLKRLFEKGKTCVGPRTCRVNLLKRGLGVLLGITPSKIIR